MQKKITEAALLGFAVGDALGVPVEFRHRSELRRDPVTNMRGFQVHCQPPGTWSDDSALSFQLIENLMEGYDPEKLGQRFVGWYLRGEWSAHGHCFDIGVSTSKALRRIEQGIPALEAGENEEYSNGNGALMRVWPLAFSLLDEPNLGTRYRWIRDVSNLTHRHVRSAIGSLLYVEVLRHLLLGLEKHDAYRLAREETSAFLTTQAVPADELELFHRVLTGNIADLPETEIYSSGYVVHTLEAALWAFLTTTTYKTALLRAVNLGDDTDTVGSLTGVLAAVTYGTASIPAAWRKVLARHDDIRELAGRFALFLTTKSSSPLSS